MLRPVQMHLCRPTAPVVARLHRSEVCTARKAAGIVRHVELDISGTPLAGQIVPGQSFGVIPPGTDERGRPHKVRLYSVASPTRGEESGPAGTIIATTVKRTIEEHWETHRLFLGVASNFLCDAQAGDPVMISGPNGKRFVLPADPAAHDYVFFATGTGIAPFRGMLLDLAAAGVRSRVALVMGASYATDLLYHDHLLRLAQEQSWLTYLTALSRERQGDGHDPMYVQDRLRTDRDALLPILESPRTLIYICGVAGMEIGIFQQMAGVLPPGTLSQYLEVEPEAWAAGVPAWTRAMIHKQVRPTRRVFLEVYA